jgi:hypothetical protein
LDFYQQKEKGGIPNPLFCPQQTVQLLHSPFLYENPVLLTFAFSVSSATVTVQHECLGFDFHGMMFQLKEWTC